MENYENIYTSLCRLCLSYTDNTKMVPLIDENCSEDGLTPYAKAVSTFTQVNFTKQDGFPSYMCSKCLCLLKQAIHFKLVTESSDNCLKKLKASVGSDKETLKEKIVEFTMLKFYFPTECFKTTRESFENEKISHQHGDDHNSMIKLKKNENPLSRINSVNEAINTPESVTQQDNIISDKDKVWDKLENFFGTFLLQSHTRKSDTMKKVCKVNEKGDKSRQREARVICKSTRKETNIKYPCSVCKKVMVNKFSYQRHMQIHNGYRYMCEHCGSGFSLNHLLQIHKISKHGSGPYVQCTQCSFRAYNNCYLNRHVRIVHAGERPYKCDKCEKAFLRLHTYKIHLLRHSDKKIQCPKCPMKFFIRGDMLDHMNSIHDRVFLYVCSECNISYKKAADVRKHMTKRHGIPREMQGKITRTTVNFSLPILSYKQTPKFSSHTYFHINNTL